MTLGSTPTRLVLLEFNELCPALLQRWMDDGSLPNFKRFFEQSQAFLTVADAEPPALEPWIQWYSLHTGLSYDQHGVFRLTDGPKSDYPDVWEIARNAGLKTFNCSSMNAKHFAGEGNIFLPDPWCTSETAYPEELNRFHSFVSKQVQEYTNDHSASRLAEIFGFVHFLATHGLRVQSVRKIMAQLISEKFKDRSLSWKRVVALDWLQADLFLHYWKKTLPDFSTFFLNSTAHFQHSYWRYMEPESFTTTIDQGDVQRFGDAIRFGYRNMDNLLGDFFALERDHGATLALATALSQQPYVKYEKIGGQRFYRAYDIAKFLDYFAIRPTKIEPTMTHQYMAHFDSSAAMDSAIDKLSRIHCGNEPVFDLDRRADQALYFGCQLRKSIPEDAAIEFGSTREVSSAFFDHFYKIDQTKSGVHHPDGVFWIHSGMHHVHRRKVSVLDIFPTLLDMLNVDYKPHTKHPYTGQSLLGSVDINSGDSFGET